VLCIRSLGNEAFTFSSQANFDNYNGTGKIRHVLTNYILHRFIFIELETEAIHKSQNSENNLCKDLKFMCN